MLTLYNVNITDVIFTWRLIKCDVKLDLKSYISLLKFESRKLSKLSNITIFAKIICLYDYSKRVKMT